MHHELPYTLWGSEVNLTLPSLPPDSKMREMDEDSGDPIHGYFQTPQGKLHYRQYLPDNGGANGGDGIKAVCIWQHGIHSHSGATVKLTHVTNADGSTSTTASNPSSNSSCSNSYSYTNMGLFSRKFQSNQIALYALDMLGHGFSEGKRFYIPNGDYTINRDGLESFARFVGETHENVPLFLMGDSYGGCLALHVARMWQNHGMDHDKDNHDMMEPKSKSMPMSPPPKQFEGICINAPAIIGDLPPLPIKLFLRHILAPLLPEYTPFFMPHPVPPERVWKDPEIRREHTSDQVKQRGLSAGGVPFCLGTASGLVKAMESVQSDIIPGFRVPFSVCHGTDDWGVKIEGTEFLVEHCETKQEDREVRLVEGAYHDLMADPTREENLEFHIRFILSRVNKLK